MTHTFSELFSVILAILLGLCFLVKLRTYVYPEGQTDGIPESSISESVAVDSGEEVLSNDSQTLVIVNAYDNSTVIVNQGISSDEVTDEPGLSLEDSSGQDFKHKLIEIIVKVLTGIMAVVSTIIVVTFVATLFSVIRDKICGEPR